MLIAIVVGALLSFPKFRTAPDSAREAQQAQELVVAGKLDEAIGGYQDLVRASPNNRSCCDISASTNTQPTLSGSHCDS